MNWDKPCVVCGDKTGVIQKANGVYTNYCSDCHLDVHMPYYTVDKRKGVWYYDLNKE